LRARWLSYERGSSLNQGLFLSTFINAAESLALVVS
jgi:hypothetical protein